MLQTLCVYLWAFVFDLHPFPGWIYCWIQQHPSELHLFWSTCFLQKTLTSSSLHQSLSGEISHNLWSLRSVRWDKWSIHGESPRWGVLMLTDLKPPVNPGTSLRMHPSTSLRSILKSLWGIDVEMLFLDSSLERSYGSINQTPFVSCSNTDSCRASSLPSVNSGTYMSKCYSKRLPVWTCKWHLAPWSILLHT